MDTCNCQADSCLLCDAKLPSDLSAEQVCGIRGLLSRRSYDPREVLVRAGDPCSNIFIVRAGHLKLTIPGTDGNEQIIGLAGEGHLLGFESMDELIYPYTAETLATTVVCKIRHRDMLQVLAQNPKVSLRLLESLNGQLVQARKLIHVLGHKTAVEKVAGFLLAQIPPTAVDGHNEVPPLTLSRAEISEMLGITVETVSRLMAEFRRMGAIDAPRGRVTILDREQLSMFAGYLFESTCHQ